MADVVTSQVLENGPRRLIMKFTSLSDSTGETGVVKVDATSTTYGVIVQGQTFVPGIHLKVADIWFNVAGMTLRIRWDADTDVDMLVLGPGNADHWDFLDDRAGFGGLSSPVVAGATGSILFTTVAAAANSNYSIILNMIKGIPQS